jgi:hypothetical protein
MPNSVKKLRCAVYTRKSTDEGLEKEFNTLDAQREACEVYVASQRAEGWVLVRDRPFAAPLRVSRGRVGITRCPGQGVRGRQSRPPR